MPSIDASWIAGIAECIGVTAVLGLLVLGLALARAADGRLLERPEKPTELMQARDRDVAFDRDFLLIAEGQPPVDSWDWPMVERESA
jgi:hypothetical protein